jgi:thioredoxin-dependent peroxiredoxin
MIDLLKATKGRRMSQQSRKKSSKTSRIGKSGSVLKSKAVAKGKTGKTRAAAAKTANKTAKTAARSAAARKPVAKRVTSAAAAKSGDKPRETSRKPAASASVPSSGVAEGAKAPNFRLPRDGGGTVSLGDYAGQKLVLFFYPRANTPGCTREAIDFTRLANDFAKCGTAVLGVSADTVKAQDSFRDKHRLAVPLVSDERHEMLEAYGAWGEKSLYGRKFLGIIRSTVLIGADGRVARIWRNVKVDGHAGQVLAAAQNL